MSADLAAGNGSKRIVERDNERFKLLFTNSRPKLPVGYSAPLCLKTTRQLISEVETTSTATK
ncbi:hypothetical protein [Aquabacter cavernae]|uniref:hypothetical protein n=1 Tax=Aquabacter cavernae TaxID=2496029 RepID=UPI000F8C9773|nr:hypothetical protein [Aquabacter cavernae]